MIRIIKGYEGDLDCIGGSRVIEEYEVNCDDCGDYIEANEEIYEVDDEELCKCCLLKRFSRGTVYDLIDSRT